VSDPRIVLTDPPPVPTDERCPRCDAGYAARRRSMTFGPVHDVCGVCGFDFDVLTVPPAEDDEI
jgi:uncharacterized protein (DUF983 family)